MQHLEIISLTISSLENYLHTYNARKQFEVNSCEIIFFEIFSG